MTKKRCKVKLCIVAILTLIGLFLTFFSFVVPTTNTTFKGFFNAINFGYDIDGGALCVYEPVEESLNDEKLDLKVQNSVTKINSQLGGLGLQATKQGQQVRVVVSNCDLSYLTTIYSKYSADILSSIGAEKGITFSTDSSDYKAEGFVGGEYIDSCTYGYAGSSNYIQVNFTEEGKTLFKQLTSKIVSENESSTGTSKRLYMFFDGEAYGSGFEIDSAVSSLVLTATDAESAKALSLRINALAKPVNLKTVSNSKISAGLNQDTGAFFGNIKSMLICAFVLMFVFACAYLIARYRMSGLLAVMCLGLFVAIYSFLLQSIPLVLIDINGLMGVAFVFVALVLNITNILERVKSEYALGKKIPNSVRSGFKKELIPTLEKYVFVLVFSAVLYLVGTVGLKAFCVSVFVGLFVNYLVLFAIYRGVMGLYININPTKKNFYNLTREVREDAEI